MSSNSDEIQATVERHNREIAELRQELRALKDGHAKKELQSEMQRRIAELEADIKLQELQEQIAADEAAKQKKRGWFHRK